ncbi:hypothetical protein SARC_03144, partial [Sphaeroforma arctica JP610]
RQVSIRGVLVRKTINDDAYVGNHLFLECTSSCKLVATRSIYILYFCQHMDGQANLGFHPRDTGGSIFFATLDVPIDIKMGSLLESCEYGFCQRFVAIVLDLSADCEATSHFKTEVVAKCIYPA